MFTLDSKIQIPWPWKYLVKLYRIQLFSQNKALISDFRKKFLKNFGTWLGNSDSSTLKTFGQTLRDIVLFEKYPSLSGIVKSTKGEKWSCDSDSSPPKGFGQTL
jgi:hypothetical protein